ncbi:MAG: hypothetical protein HC933_10415 [Pleurocapsa sp. SU_196_0]|nr:hypothetical protein [Pleurocapsa sp. SU_196_0]
MARFTRKHEPVDRASSQGLVLGCPDCASRLDLVGLRDGDQAYWCHRCERGWRIGNLPDAARMSKDAAREKFETFTPDPTPVPVSAPANTNPKRDVKPAPKPTNTSISKPRASSAAQKPVVVAPSPNRNRWSPNRVRRRQKRHRNAVLGSAPNPRRPALLPPLKSPRNLESPAPNLERVQFRTNSSPCSSPPVSATRAFAPSLERLANP